MRIKETFEKSAAPFFEGLGLLLDSVGECQVGLPADHLGFTFSKEVFTLDDESVDARVEQVGDVEHECTSVVQDPLAG